MNQIVRKFCICILIFTSGSEILCDEALTEIEATEHAFVKELHNLSNSLVFNKSGFSDVNYTPDGILTSIPVNIFKRSDEEGIGSVDNSLNSNGANTTTKKKPKLYSWWMPNMTMTNSGGQWPSTSEEPIESSTITMSSDSITSRPTRKPRPSRPPRTKRPSKTPRSTTSVPLESNKDSTTKPPTTTAAPTAFTTRKTNQVSSTTEPSGSFVDPYGVKRKFVHVAKKVGKAAVTTLGVVGSVAVGSAVSTIGSQVAPIASIAVSKAGSAALSAATHVGSYAADAAGRALINFAASLKNSTRTDQNDEEIPLAKPIELIPKKATTTPEDLKMKDEGKIVTVYVTHTHMGDQPANSNLTDEISRKTNTVYHKEDRILMETPHVQDMEEMVGMTNSNSSSRPINPEESEDELVYERAQNGDDEEGDEPTIPLGAKKIVNKDDRKMGKNSVSTVSSSKPRILMTLAIGTLTVMNII